MLYLNKNINKKNPEESTWQYRSYRWQGFNPWVGKIPWRRKWQNPLQYSCLENPNGQRSLVGCSQSLQKSDTTERLSMHTQNSAIAVIVTSTPISITTTASTTVIIICYILEWTWDPILWREFRVVLGRPVPQ